MLISTLSSNYLLLDYCLDYYQMNFRRLKIVTTIKIKARVGYFQRKINLQ